MILSARSLTEVPSFWAWTINLSLTSVMFTTQVTSNPQKVKITFDHIENHRADHVAEVALRIDRRSADVHADLARSDRPKRFFFLSQSVINAQIRIYHRFT